MTILPDYREYAGIHWETGTVRNALAYQGVRAPHTGQPYSEALLLGVSGGIAFGYFTFAYQGYDPQCNILTRNTFDPLPKMLARLGVPQHLQRTASPEKARRQLRDALDSGVPAIVWADLWSLPYNGLEPDDGMWGMMPILVHGYDETSDTVYIADQACVPLTVSGAELARARARTQKNRHQLMTLGPPQPEKLPQAVREGLDEALQLYMGRPPKGSKNNFGLSGLQYWAKMLAHPKQRHSWAKLFPPGLPLYAGLTSAYLFSMLFGKGLTEDAERLMFAAFLDEAAIILAQPDLRDVATRFRQTAPHWQALGQALLPDAHPPLAEARQLMRRRRERFLEAGGESLDERKAIDARLQEIRQQMMADFPLTAEEVTALLQTVAERVLAVHDAEQAAVQALQAVLDWEEKA